MTSAKAKRLMSKPKITVSTVDAPPAKPYILYFNYLIYLLLFLSIIPPLIYYFFYAGWMCPLFEMQGLQMCHFSRFQRFSYYYLRCFLILYYLISHILLSFIFNYTPSYLVAFLLTHYIINHDYYFNMDGARDILSNLTPVTSNYKYFGFFPADYI